MKRPIFYVLFFLLINNVLAAYAVEEKGIRIDPPIEKKAASLYSQAARLYEQGRFEEAYNKFNQAYALATNYDKSKYYLRCIASDLNIQPDNTYAEARKTEKEHIIILKSSPEKRANELYSRAIEFYKQGQYDKAYEKFKEAQEIQPNYDRSKYYLRQIADDLKSQHKRSPPAATTKSTAAKAATTEAKAAKEQQQRIASLHKQAIALFEKGQFDQAKEMFNQILSIDPHNKEAKLYIDKKIPARMQALGQQKVESLYKDGVTCFEKKDYSASANIFNEVLAISPSHQKAKDYINIKIPQAIKQQKIESLYKDGLSYFEKEDFQQATIAFKDILALDDKEKKAADYINIEIPRAIQQRKIRILYSDGLDYFEKGQFDRAKGVFNQILSIDPKEAKAKEYIESLIPKRIEEIRLEKEMLRKKEEEKKAEQKHKILWEAAHLYDEALTRYESRYYEDAYRLFTKVNDMVPGFADTQEYLDKLRTMLPAKNKK